MTNKLKIDILLSTFNGSKYLDAQIQSIVSQSYINFSLIVRDDASTDATLEILQKWKSLDRRIYIVQGNKNIGAALSFTELVKNSNADVLFFSDQDDIWLKDKIQWAVDFFQKTDNINTPILLMHDGFSFSDDRGFINDSIQIARPNNLKDFFFLNGGLYGCCMAFNRQMADLYIHSLPETIFMHDHQMTLAALCYGKIEYSDVKFILYRKHASNVSGGPLSKSEKIINFIFSRTEIINGKSLEAIKSFFEKNKSTLNEDKIFIFEKFLIFPSLNFIYKFLYILKYDFRIYKSKGLLIYKLLFR